MTTFLNSAFYRFAAWPEFRDSRPEIRSWCTELELRGTILLAPEGINGSICGKDEVVRELIARIRGLPPFRDLETKETRSNSQSFARMKVRLKKEIITMGASVDVSRTGVRLEAESLREWIDEARDFLLVDTRNNYETSEGTFKGALDLGIACFHEFPAKIEQIREQAAGRPVVMFCTGGIRCEKATALALEHGIPEVYQLDGGILRYFERCGDRHFDGECFVFDDRGRVAAPSKAC